MKANFSNESLAVDGVLTSNNTTEERQRSGIYVTVAQAAISFLLLIISSCANGLLLFLLSRFKKLRTTANILVADLAITDVLNIIINVPLFVCYGALDLDAFRGKLTSWLVSTFHVSFSYLTLTTMFLMMIDRFLAIQFPLRYKTVKTKKRVILAILIKWLASFIAVLCVYFPLHKIDLGKRSVLEYRVTYSRESNALIPRAFSPPVLLGSICLYLISRRTLRNSFRRYATANGLPCPQHVASQKRKRKAINTILIIIIVFCISYLPEILRSVWPLSLSGSARQWLMFVVGFLLFLPAISNPFIYFRRIERFQSALTELRGQRESGIADRQLHLKRWASLRKVRKAAITPSKEVNQTSDNWRSRNTNYGGKVLYQGTVIRRNSEVICAWETELHVSRHPMNLSTRYSI